MNPLIYTPIEPQVDGTTESITFSYGEDVVVKLVMNGDTIQLDEVRGTPEQIIDLILFAPLKELEVLRDKPDGYYRPATVLEALRAESEGQKCESKEFVIAGEERKPTFEQNSISICDDMQDVRLMWKESGRLKSATLELEVQGGRVKINKASGHKNKLEQFVLLLLWAARVH